MFLRCSWVVLGFVLRFLGFFDVLDVFSWTSCEFEAFSRDKS